MSTHGEAVAVAVAWCQVVATLSQLTILISRILPRVERQSTTPIEAIRSQTEKESGNALPRQRLPLPRRLRRSGVGQT